MATFSVVCGVRLQCEVFHLLEYQCNYFATCNTCTLNMIFYDLLYTRVYTGPYYKGTRILPAIDADQTRL